MSSKSTERPSQVLVFLVLAAVAFAVYGGALKHDFLFNWDDNLYVTGNEAIRGFTLSNLKTVFTSFYVGNYAPLHVASYMLDYRLWGLNPMGYHLVGILLHAVNAFLAFRVFLALDSRRPVAFLAAILFLVHPVQVETVAWVSERKTLLALSFSLLSLLAYMRYADGEAGSRRKWYLLALAGMSAALLSKAVAVVLPAMFLCYDWYSAGKSRGVRSILDKVPFLVLSVAITLVTMVSQRSAECIVNYLGDSPVNNAMTMMPVFARYLYLIFWPLHLGPIYKPPIKTVLDYEVVFSFLLLLAFVAIGFSLLYRRRLAGFALAIFIIGLLPVSHIFPIPTLMQDRYLYFPFLGFSLFFALLVVDTATAVAGSSGLRLGGICLSLLALLLAVAARGQTGIWRNSLSLWTHAAENVPASKQAWIMLATTRHDLKDLAGAEKAYLRLLSMAPREIKGLNGIGVLYGELGDLDKSLHYLRQAAQIAPGDPNTLVNYGYAAFLKGELHDARDALNRALAANPALSARIVPVLMEIARRQNDREELERLQSLTGQGI